MTTDTLLVVEVHVRPLPGNDALGDFEGAFVNAVVPSDLAGRHHRAIRDTLFDLGFEAVNFGEEGWIAPRELDTIDRELHSAMTRALDAGSIRFGPFHAYERE